MWGIHRQVAGRCPCRTQHAACGPPSTSIPIDQRMEVAAVGGPLQKYRVVMPNGVETVMKLNATDAERYGGVPLDADDEQSAPAAEPAGPAKGRRGAANKARTSAPNKAASGDGS